MKKTFGVKFIVCVLMVVIVGLLAANISKTSTVDCETCGGAGQVAVMKDGAAVLEKCGDCDGAGKCEAQSRYYSTFVSLVPPIVAISLALIFKEAYSSLFIGVLLGAMLNANFSFVETVNFVTVQGFSSAVSDNAGIFVFLVILGIVVALINKTGGSQAFGKWAATHIKSRTGACLATFVLGVLIFIDDYFNCLTVGAVMRPVTDNAKVSRVKLAYLIDATAAPICMIAPISSWAAAVSGCVDSSRMSGFELFVKAIPFNFYSLLTIVFIIAISLMNFDYGKMKSFEATALKGDLIGNSGDVLSNDEEMSHGNGRTFDLIIPIVVLIITCVLGLLIVGGYFGGDYNMDFIGAFGNTDAFVGLPWGGIITLVFIIIYTMARRLITFEDAMACIPKGFMAMVPAILILVLATSLKNMTVALGSRYFVHDVMQNAAASFFSFLPAIIFLVGCAISFATGTSWGTFGILIPIVTNIFSQGDPLLFVGISACLAGAVCGDHCSPISDTTIMASAGAQCNHLDHVATQLPYAITVAAISFVCFIISGFFPVWYVMLPVGAVLTVAALFVIRAFTRKKA